MVLLYCPSDKSSVFFKGIFTEKSSKFLYFSKNRLDKDVLIENVLHSVISQLNIFIIDP